MEGLARQRLGRVWCLRRGHSALLTEAAALLEVLSDPGHEVGDPGVNAWVLALAAADAPAHDADLRPAAFVDHEWAAAVPLQPKALVVRSRFPSSVAAVLRVCLPADWRAPGLSVRYSRCMSPGWLGLRTGTTR